MKILAFGASTSSTSINRRFAVYAANQVAGAEVTDLDLRDFDLPIYSADLEAEQGAPADAQRFLDLIQSHDGLVISMAEHNGSYSAAFKNLYDWTSRIEKNVWCGKPMLLLSTSPGGRGGESVMETAKATFPRMGADLKATFSLPNFAESFDDSEGIGDAELNALFVKALGAFSD
ncbi:MAG: NAD(P)H-dependent oxidoreductase [Gammaproteobacteria bacterium]|nr:NAD(P)H-dependent oxidoreductase [Gammaproteobacteria bacterium]NND54116.1 NAD(P)H-dependent oxidoreductase [Gammaproteobacteria bacterium]